MNSNRYPTVSETEAINVMNIFVRLSGTDESILNTLNEFISPRKSILIEKQVLAVLYVGYERGTRLLLPGYKGISAGVQWY